MHDHEDRVDVARPRDAVDDRDVDEQRDDERDRMQLRQHAVGSVEKPEERPGGALARVLRRAHHVTIMHGHARRSARSEGR